LFENLWNRFTGWGFASFWEAVAQSVAEEINDAGALLGFLGMIIATPVAPAISRAKASPAGA